jgi:hypothetical protein
MGSPARVVVVGPGAVVVVGWGAVVVVVIGALVVVGEGVMVVVGATVVVVGSPVSLPHATASMASAARSAVVLRLMLIRRIRSRFRVTESLDSLSEAS